MLWKYYLVWISEALPLRVIGRLLCLRKLENALACLLVLLTGEVGVLEQLINVCGASWSYQIEVCCTVVITLVVNVPVLPTRVEWRGRFVAARTAFSFLCLVRSPISRRLTLTNQRSHDCRVRYDLAARRLTQTDQSCH